MSQPDRPPNPPFRALAAYAMAVTPVVFGAPLLLGLWLGSLGLHWLPVVVAQLAAMKLLLSLSGPLSVPAIYWMCRRWPALDRDGVLAREDDPHAA